MKTIFVFCIAVFVFFSCAKKITATSSSDSKMPADSTNLVESSMSIAGHETYNVKCGNCHGLKDPAAYTQQEWLPIMNRMAPNARLDSIQKANVLAYVNFHAKK